FALGLLGRLVAGNEVTPRILGRTNPLAKVPHGVIHAPQVIVGSGLGGAPPEPGEIVALHGGEVEVRQPPILSGRRKVIGRNAEARVPSQQLGVRPDIDAVVADDERLVPAKKDSAVLGVAPNGLPLHLRSPLFPAVKKYLSRQPLPLRRQVIRSPLSKAVRPLPPGAVLLRFGDRGKQRKRVEPPRFALLISLKIPSELAPAVPVAGYKVIK